MEYFVFHNNTGSFQRVTQGLTIGRTSGGIRYPSDLLVSREQCRFLIVGSEVYVEDSGSTNPTRINSVPLRPGKPRRVRLNDVIEFGSQRLILTNTGTNRINSLDGAGHSNFGTATWLTRNRLHLDAAVSDLWNFQLKQFRNKLWVATGKQNAWHARILLDTHDIELQALTNAVVFAWNNFVIQHERSSATNVNINIATLSALNSARNNLSFAALKLLDNGLALSFTQTLQDNLLSSLRSNATKILFGF
jgi:hypothetical protein